jgi:hypothetical protein
VDPRYGREGRQDPPRPAHCGPSVDSVHLSPAAGLAGASSPVRQGGVVVNVVFGMDLSFYEVVPAVAAHSNSAFLLMRIMRRTVAPVDACSLQESTCLALPRSGERTVLRTNRRYLVRPSALNTARNQHRGGRPLRDQHRGGGPLRAATRFWAALLWSRRLVGEQAVSRGVPQKGELGRACLRTRS